MRSLSSLFAGVVLLSTSVALAGPLVSPVDRHAFVPGVYALYLDGATKPSALLPSISGGGASTEMIVERPGAAGTYPKKHAGNVLYDDITFALPGAAPRDLGQWMTKTV